MGPFTSFEDVTDMLRARSATVVLVVCLGVIAALIFAKAQPINFQASEVIQITRSKLSQDLAPRPVAGSTAHRLQLIEQRLKSRDALLEIVTAYDLFAGRPIAEQVSRLRSAVTFETIAAPNQGPDGPQTLSQLTITATMPTPQQARDVAQEFAHRTINLSIRARIAQARSTLTFFAKQEDQLTRYLAVLAEKQAAVRTANDLPESKTRTPHQSEILGVETAATKNSRARNRLKQPAKTRADGQSVPSRDLSAQTDQNPNRIARQTELARSIAPPPAIAAELVQFQRDIEQAQAQLDLVSTRRMDAELRLAAETQRQGERLSVIEPAELPQTPVARNQVGVILAGVGLSILAALSVAIIAELWNPVIHSKRKLRTLVGDVPVFGVPFVRPARAPNRHVQMLRRRLRRLFRRTSWPSAATTASQDLRM